MNKLYLKSIFAAWLMLCVGVSAWAATTYCGTTITSVNQNHSAAITCSSLGENRYLFEFVSEDEFTGYNAGSNFFMKVNGTVDYQVSQHLTKDGKRLYVEFTSTSVPNIYVGAFYVLYSDGEAQYNIPIDADFSKVCSGGTKQASDLTLTEPATTILDLQIGGEFSIQYTTSSTGAVAFSSSNTDVAIVSAAGVINALTAGTTTITVSQAEDETYNAGSKSFTLSVIEVYAGQCTFSGTKGDGQSHDGGTSLFTKGYNISLYLNSRKDTIFVKVEFLDDDKTAKSALFQNYPQRDEKVEVKEWRFNREGSTQVFSGKVPVSELSNKADGIIRFGIKFEFDGGLRVTTPEFYYLDGSGCAERDFVIYHHDQMPEDPERDAAVHTFKGGRILQPIVYKRKLKPGIWETLSLPFDVSKITVSEGEVEYELHAQYTDNNNTTHEGEFWLRDFREKEVSAEEFQANWHDIQDTTAALPKKNVPYIIRVPDDNTHYWADKYIVFHGASYQTIDSVYSPNVQVPEAEDMFAYSGNNTMKEWKLRSAYVLDNEGIYFESGETVTLYPFECAVNAKIETTRAMPRLALNRKTGVPTGNLPPTTAVEPGNVWSVTGWYVGSFCDSNQYDRLMQRLPAGMYVVRQAETTYKVYIAK